MGRPLDSRHFGNPTGSGNQIVFASCWIPGEGSANTTSYVVKQIGTSKFLAHNSATGKEGIVTLQAGTATAPGQAQILLSLAGHGGGAIVSPRLGVNAAAIVSGTGYAANDVLTLSNGATLKVTTVDGGGGITGVNVISAGSFVTLPTNPVAASGGTGTGATFDLGYKLVSFVIVNGGEGYNNGATLSVTGNGAGTAIFTDGVITGAIITAAGTYTSVPTVTITAVPAGVGAVVTPALGVSSVIISGGSANYTIGDVLTLPNGAALRVNTIGGGGVITNVSITAPGSFSSVPSNPVSGSGGTGTGGAFNLTFKLVSLTVTSQGGGYVNGATLTLSGTGTGTLTVSRGAVTAASITAPGSYTSFPTATVVGGFGGTDAARSIWSSKVNTFKNVSYFWATDGSIPDSRWVGVGSG